MKVYNFNGVDVTLKVIRDVTPNRIQLYEAKTGEPYASATVSMTELSDLEGYVAVKDYAENEGMLQFLVENGIVHPPVTHLNLGYAKIPICKIKSI